MTVADLGIGGYEQPEEIGRGGYSVVYRAWQPAFQRWVAIKVITGTLDERALGRFERECAAIGMLSGHPNIVTVYESGRTPRGEPFIIMELLTGSLAQQIAGQRLPWRTAVAVGVHLAGALDAAHRAGVLHRDVKPENVLISSYGAVKLADFGIARLEGFNETRPGVVTASVLHAAPEVLDGHRPTVASDVYSLGSTMYAALAGRPPFPKAPEESSLALYKRIAADRPPPLPADVPGAVARIIERALAKDPAQRPPSAAALGEELRAASDGLDPDASASASMDAATFEPTHDAPRPEDAATAPAPVPPSPPPSRSTRRGGSRGRLVAGAVAVAVIAAAAIAMLASSGGGGSGDNASSSTTAGATTTVGPVTGGTGATSNPTPTTVAPGPATTVAGGVVLGVDLKPDTFEPCRSPTIATGAAWQVGAQQVNGRAFQYAYTCNLFAGATGSLDFVLGGSYRVLRTTIGFADRSAATNHVVRYEMIGDGTTNLIDPITLRFGQVQDLNLDVSGITRLRIRITELSPAGGSESPSQPVLASPTLLRS